MMVLYGRTALSRRGRQKRVAQLRLSFQFHLPLGIDTPIECISLNKK